MSQSLIRSLALSLCWAMTIVPATVAQERQHLLTNQDVIDMVQSGLQESTVVAAIRANSTNFDVSAAALIKLKKVGATQRIMDTMLAAESNKHTAAAVPSVSNATPAMPVPGDETNAGGTAFSASSGALPSVTLVLGSTRRSLTLEKAQLAGTKTKASSLRSLARDNLLKQG